MGPPAEDTKFPRGLRVEDLKPPPAKRQRVKPGMAPSPAASNFAGTPKSEGQGQTPASFVESPATMAKKGTGSNTKRKREASTSISVAGKTPREIVAELKAGAGYGSSPRPLQVRTPLPQQVSGNALGIELDSNAEKLRDESFFAAHEALRGLGGVDVAVDNGDIWSALSSALEGYKNTPQPSLEAGVRVEPAADELFEQFLDMSQMDPGGDEAYWGEPTPELWRVSSREDGVSPVSPESIKTVGSTATLGMSKSGIEEEEVSLDKGKRRMLGMSPEGGSYNGLILGGFDDEGLDFGAIG
jgi:hypothetical protein